MARPELPPRLLVLSDRTVSDEALLEAASALRSFGPDVGLVVRDASARREGLLAALRERMATGWLVRKVSGAGEPDDASVDAIHLGGAPWRPFDGALPRSVAIHQARDAERAEELGAAWGLVSPIFVTPGKGPARGLHALTEARACAPSVRLFALGGVVPATTSACLRAGADGVAVVRGVLHAPDPAAAARAYLEAMDHPA